ncbi:MAG: DUF484 family protein [Pseudomonadota bacterium]
MKPNADDVAQYLKSNPEFFEQYADLLANIYIPHPHGGRAIPISERQILTLREKNKLLETKLRELIRFGEENDAIGERVHRITLAMMLARDLPALLHSLYFNLREDFAVPHVALRLWTGDHGELPEFQTIGQEARVFANSLTAPYCSAQPMLDTGAWFGEAASHLRSFAYVSLRTEQTFGLLVLASEDAQRFYPEMGTLYLKRLGELVSVALAHHLGQH